MNLDDVMREHDGKWETDTATVRLGAYFVQVAKKVSGKIELTEEGLRSFPALGITAAKAPVAETVSTGDGLAIAPEHALKKKKLGLK